MKYTVPTLIDFADLNSNSLGSCNAVSIIIDNVTIEEVHIIASVMYVKAIEIGYDTPDITKMFLGGRTHYSHARQSTVRHMTMQTMTDEVRMTLDLSKMELIDSKGIVNKQFVIDTIVQAIRES